MSPELEKAIAATEGIVAWRVAASSGTAGQEARQAILALALSAAGVQRSDMPPPPPVPASLRVTVTFPGGTSPAAFGAVLDAARVSGATHGTVTSDIAPGFAFTETYPDGEVVR